MHIFDKTLVLSIIYGKYLLSYWSFPIRVPLRLGWKQTYCVTGLMAFLYFNLPLAKLRLKHFLCRSLLTTSFHLKFSLPQNLFHLATSSICRRSRLLLSSSVGCCCFIFIPHIQQIIAWSLILVREKSVDMGHVSLQASKTVGPIGSMCVLGSKLY